MKQKLKIILALTIALTIVSVTGVAQESAASKTAVAKKPMPEIDQKIIDIIKQINEEALKLDFAKAQSVDIIEKMVDGKKLNYTQNRTVIVKRPDQILVDSRGDIANMTIVKSENMLKLYNHDENVYSEKEIRGTIDDFKDNVLIPYGLSVPLAEFFSSTPYTSLMKHTQEAKYLGEGLVGDVPCHHMLFVQENIDWQMWVDKGDKPIPRRVVVTYKHEEGQPQYITTFKSIEKLTGDVKDAINYKPDPGMVPIEFMPLVEKEQ